MITQIKKGQIYSAYYKDGFYYDSPECKIHRSRSDLLH